MKSKIVSRECMTKEGKLSYVVTSAEVVRVNVSGCNELGRLLLGIKGDSKCKYANRIECRGYIELEKADGSSVSRPFSFDQHFNLFKETDKVIERKVNKILDRYFGEVKEVTL